MGGYAPDTGGAEYGTSDEYASTGEHGSTELYSQPDLMAHGEGSTLRPRSAMEVLTGLSEKVSQGAMAEYQQVPLGFSPLDRALGGGIRSGELMLIGGAQGTGKTTMSLQMGRNIAQSGEANGRAQGSARNVAGTG